MLSEFARSPRTIPSAPRPGLCKGDGPFTLALHGGAQSDSDPRESQAGWLKALLGEAGGLLQAGATALDIVEWTVWRMEQSGLFNAGRGGLPNRDNIRELDAAIMNGADRSAGAVASVVVLPSPIAAARWVMEQGGEQGGPVLLVGGSAERSLGFEPAPRPEASGPGPREYRFGTVGAVALDRDGNLAAATSTGGTARKIPGRVGDSPIVGAGTWADNASVAVSGTGDGEHFIRHALAHEVHACIAYRGCTVGEAVHRAIHEFLPRTGGQGGLIAVDRTGAYGWAFNSKGMMRGAVTDREEAMVAVL